MKIGEIDGERRKEVWRGVKIEKDRGEDGDVESVEVSRQVGFG